ncbi:MAG: triple tyrosine motif-containing protein [Clostridium sp.]|nr:triple tyrosine motif-containing protein [Clostridium sp.]
MDEVEIKFNVNSPQKANSDIIISIISEKEKNLSYKYLVGLKGKWEVLMDFSKELNAKWKPLKDGVYTIMIQARREKSTKSFDYITKRKFTIGEKVEKIIEDIVVDKDELTVGEKITANVKTLKEGILYKYYIVEGKSWILLKDYSAENTITWTATKIGKQKIVVKCKMLDSNEECEDSADFNVMPMKKIEIKDFKCLTQELLMGNEIIFQVDVQYDDSRLVLYKFIKIDKEGHGECIQNYSTKRIVSYVEDGFGEFKLLCMVKDMYSPEEYDERAVIVYNVKKYNKIKIKSFISDVSSPQSKDSEINLKAVAVGGINLVYRYIIEGNNKFDSGYIKNSKFLWKPKQSGNYKIKLMVKDESFDGESEDSDSFEFLIEDEKRDPVTIKEIIRDKKENILVGETVNIKAIAKGGIDLRYAFVVTGDNGENESISYGTCNWVNYTAEKAGNYKIEIKVKDKFSKNDYDCHEIQYVEAMEYIPAKIDYVLKPYNDHYMLGDKIELVVVSENTRENLNKYKLFLNGRLIEETEYISCSKYTIKPKSIGKYEVEIYAKNKKSDREFDCSRMIYFNVFDTLPVTDTCIECNKINPKVNESVDFKVTCKGGKKVLYEFYLFENGEWGVVQKYSRKNYYSFMPFKKGEYKILALCKSQYKKCSYEDYAILEIQAK